MGIALPQLAPASEDRVSGALVIDGSLRFDQSKSQYFSFTPTTTGNRRTWTFSCWFKKMEDSANRVIFSSYGSSPWTAIQTTGNNDGRIQATFDAGISSGYYTDGRYRDNGWYHLVWAVDTTHPADPDKSKVYINGVLQTYGSNAHPSLNEETPFNLASRTMYIGYTPNQLFDGHMSQCYFIDGQALAPEFFGYTDPLTGVWRPRGKLKKTVNDGTNFTADITNTGSTLNNPGRIFDGTIDSDATIASGAATITYTPSTPIKYTNSVRVMGSGSPSNPYNARWQLNGGSNVSTVNSNTFVTLDSGNGGGTITSIKLTVDSGGANWRAIEVDGVIMKANAAEAVNFGTNGFYLPMDGNSLIGKDQSGQGNDWTPVNFGGSTTLDKATGAKPILNTGNGGNVARPGVFGSEASAFYETTSASNSGGQYYFSHDSSAKPTFSFVRGATYTFDYSASSSHPLRFATAADAAGNTEYTDGTSISGNVIKFTVPHNAPDTLYYYCNVHNGMGNSISVTTDETKADPYAWKCILAMPMISEHDVSGDMNCTTTNDAITNNSVAFNDDQSVFYNRSADPDGSQYFSGVDLSSWNTEQPWTVEFWWYRTGANTNNHGHFVGGTIGGTNQYGPTYRDGSHNDWQFNFKGQSIVITPSPALQTDKWEHHAFTSDGNNITYFRDGVFQTTAGASSMTGSWGSSNEIFRGGAGWNSQYVVGHVCDMRIYAGVEKYTTAGFIPASTDPDILPNSPSGVATKSKLKKITDGAVVFDGTGDALRVADHADLRFGTGAFTIECYVWFNSFDDNYPSIISKYTGGTASWIMRVRNTGTAIFYSAVNGGTNNESSASVISLNRWHHIAMVREGTGSNQSKMYVDGKLVVTCTDGTDYNDTQEVTIGAQNASDSNVLNGYMSNVRIIKGTALYTSEFTPPTEPLTNVTNTKLLTCQTPTTHQIAAVAPLVSGINDGTVWSSSITSDSLFRSGFPATYAFNGTTKSSTNDCAATPQTAGQGFAFTFGEGVPFTTLQMQCDDNNGGYVFVNGVDITSQLPTGSLTNTTITGVTSPLTSIRLISHNGSAAYLGSVTIDGTMLVDPLTPSGDVVTTNFNPFNTDINTVRGQEGAYATLDPLDHRLFTNGPSYVLSDGNLTCDVTGGNANASKSRGLFSSNMEIPLGKKIYCEFDHPYLYNDDYALGITSQLVRGYYETSGNAKPGAYMLRVNGIFYSPAEQLGASTDRAFTTSDIIGMAVDLESADKTITWYKNGEEIFNYQIDIDQGPFKFSAGTDPGSNVATYKIHVNFGQKPFKYNPPEGFQALTSSIIKPDTIITHPERYVKATTYDGSGAVQDVNIGFKPDLIWVKDRDDTNNHNNNLIDSVNGAPNLWMSDNPTSLVTNSTDGLTAITSNGFTLGANTAGTQSYELNKSGNGYIAWTWKAGGNEGTFNIDDADVGSAANAKMSIGSLNNDAYDQSQRWRDNITSSNGWNVSYPVNNIFNGSFDGGGGAANNGNGGVVIFTPPAAITVTKLELSIYNDVTLTLPDGTTQDLIGVGSADRYVEADIGSGFSFTGSNSITISRTGGFIYLERIKINGKELVDDDITPTNVPSIAATACSVGTKQGFSIIKYTGGGSGSANSNSNKGVPHGLGEAPDFIIGKNLDSSNAPMVYHSGLPSGTINLSSTNGNDTSSFIWAKKQPSKHEVFLGNNPEINGSNNYILYCWHNISGLQKFGTYDGISSSDGTVIDLGFRPRILLLKRYSSDHSNAGWHWYDTARDTVNPAYKFTLADKPYTELRAANNTAHISTYYVDFLANGFKLRHNSTNLNDGSVKYLYAAWAEAPAFNLFGAQSNAR